MSRFSVSRETTRRAQHLRREATTFEKMLWARLARGQIGWPFRRQHPVGPYIVDFYCAPLKLCVEIDGDSHGLEGGAERDAQRTAYLERKGFTVIRFWNSTVRENADGVAEEIAAVCRSIAARLPSLEKGGLEAPASSAKPAGRKGGFTRDA